MARELGWYLSGSASSPSSSSLGSSWSSLDQHLDEEGIMDTKPMSPQNGLLFCRETHMAKILARLTGPPAPSGGKQGVKYHPPEQRPINRLKFPTIVRCQEKCSDLMSAAPYGASAAYMAEQPHIQGCKKSRIPVPKDKKNNMSGEGKTKLPAVQMEKSLVAQTNASISHPVVHAQPMERPEVKCLSKPKMAICEALELLSKIDWEKKIAGLQVVRSLSVHHPDFAALRIQELHAAVTHEVIIHL
ncbi:uncharacterized protein LOC142741742 [Rhinoderma darwinii]|uniref:uncharacterized protein LOC142741742 n=1 Tax=Rhinoderma darwinii TaxID=43563 RepID=UPI003F66A4A5